MSFAVLGMAGTILSLTVVFVLIVLVCVFRRGSALAAGLIGGALLLIGFIMPSVVCVIAVFLGTESESALPDDTAVGFVIMIIPWICKGAGLILVAVSAVARPRVSRLRAGVRPLY